MRAGEWILPAEGETWLLALLVVTVLLGAARPYIEPWLDPPLDTQAPASVDTASVGRLDLNHATALELESLPAIGPKLAARVVAYRDSHGAFGDVGDLLAVRGIGAATRERIAPHVRVVAAGDSAVVRAAAARAQPPSPP